MRPCLLATLCLIALPTVRAQRDDTHRGMTYAFGIGRGSMSLTCNGCETTPQADISGLLRVGWTLRENMVIAGETVGFQKAQLVNLETLRATYVWGGAVLLWYPRRYSEGFLKLGAGVSHSSGTFDVAGTGPAELELNSTGFLAGLGADLRLGRTFSTTIFVDYHLTLPSEADARNGAPLKLDSRVLNVGIALTYH